VAEKYLIVVGFCYKYTKLICFMVVVYLPENSPGPAEGLTWKGYPGIPANSLGPAGI